MSCYEKFIVDVELLRELRHEFTPLEMDEASLAFDTQASRWAQFLGAAHTLDRVFYRPLLSSTETSDRSNRTARAGEIWRSTLVGRHRRGRARRARGVRGAHSGPLGD